MKPDSKLKIIMALIGIVGGGGAGYYSGLAAIGERVRAAEVRQDEQYKALMQRVDDLRDDVRELRTDMKSDINGTRAEIMGILKERR